MWLYIEEKVEAVATFIEKKKKREKERDNGVEIILVQSLIGRSKGKINSDFS